MAKYFVLLLLITFPALANDPCSVDDYTPIKERYESGLLFKLKKCGEKTSYLFGTMHSDSPELLPLLGPVKEAMLQSNSANFEIKSGQEQTVAALHAMYFPANSTLTLKNAIGAELYRQLQTLLAKERPDMPEMFFQRMKPWAIAVMMQYPEQEADGVHIDLRLENYAKSNKIAVFGLETAVEQLKFFEELSNKESVEFLRETIESFQEAKGMGGELTEAYKTKDLIKISTIADESFAKMKNADFQQRFFQDLIKNRNKIMVERAMPRMADGAFIAVGALHLPWEHGLLKLFENQGYHIYVAD